MAAVTLLNTENIGRAFGGLHAVRDVTFELSQGEIHALIGPNGAGKTTFVNLLSGRLRCDSGKIFYRDRDITGLSAHKRVRCGIAYTFQITSIYPNLSVFDNVAVAVQSAARFQQNEIATVSDLRVRVEAILTRVDLQNFVHNIAGELAYGHQRLLEVAMGLALQPKLLMLDEPTQGLSDPEIESFCELIRDIGRSTTILLIEHNMAVVMTLADNITVLDQGAVLATGDPDSIRQNPAVQAAYLGT